MNTPLPNDGLRSRTSAAHVGVGASEVSVQAFRDAMSQVATAVYVISTDGPAGRSGMTCSAVCAANDTPPMIIACVHSGNAANRVFRENGVFCVNSLAAGQSELSQQFASSRGVPIAERFAGDAWGTLTTGAPHYRHALVAMDCEIADVRELGSHSVFFARVVATAIGEPADPLVYQRRAYATTRAL